MKAAIRSDLRNLERPLGVQQLARSSINTGHASRGDLCNPLRNSSTAIKVQPAASVVHNQAWDGRRWVEVSSFGCWDERFLPWLPRFMVNDDPQCDYAHRMTGTAGDHGELQPCVVSSSSNRGRV